MAVPADGKTNCVRGEGVRWVTYQAVCPEIFIVMGFHNMPKRYI